MLLRWKHKGKEITRLPIGIIGFLYLIITPNGKMYIGQTVAKDWRGYWGGGRRLSKYYAKYGKKGTRRIILMFFNNSHGLDQAEQHLTKITNAKESDKFYNRRDGGFNNGSPSIKTRQAISKAGKGRKFSAKARQKMRESQLGSSNNSATLNEKQVTEILRLGINPIYKSGKRYKRGFFSIIADYYGVTRKAVSMIIYRTRWQHIEMPTKPLAITKINKDLDELKAADILNASGPKPHIRKISQEVAMGILKLSIGPDMKRGLATKISKLTSLSIGYVCEIIERKGCPELEMPTESMTFKEFEELVKCQSN